MSPASEPTGLVADWIDGIERLTEQVAEGLNFPAGAAAALSLVPLEDRLHSGASRELATHIVAALYVPFLRYLIGRRIDKRDDLRATLLSKRKRALAVSAVVGLLLLGGLMLWNFSEGQRYTMSSLSLLWIVSGLVAIGTGLRQSASSTLPR